MYANFTKIHVVWKPFASLQRPNGYTEQRNLRKMNAFGCNLLAGNVRARRLFFGILHNPVHHVSAPHVIWYNDETHSLS